VKAGTLAIDVGGTFTDVTFADAATGSTWVAKTPSTPGDLSAGFLTAVRKALALAGRPPGDVIRVLHADGVDVIYYIAQENYPVEYVERDFPLRIERYTVRPDSGGPGFHRGGAGVIRDVRVLCERAELATRMENTLVAPYGVGGGHAGRTGRVVLNPGTPGEREVPGQGDGLEVRRGDLLRFETCGGGGRGDPLTRDPMRVRQDVARGFVSLRGAREDYGVVLDPATLEIDKQATDDERARRAGERPLIDRGPGFEEAEALWRTSRIRSV
jgi:N-methylhydantoinase B